MAALIRGLRYTLGWLYGWLGLLLTSLGPFNLSLHRSRLSLYDTKVIYPVLSFPFSFQGQVEARATLQVPDAEEQAEFYVVLEGSRLTHVTVAKRTEDGASLSFTVPGESLGLGRLG